MNYIQRDLQKKARTEKFFAVILIIAAVAVLLSLEITAAKARAKVLSDISGKPVSWQDALWFGR